MENISRAQITFLGVGIARAGQLRARLSHHSRGHAARADEDAPLVLPHQPEGAAAPHAPAAALSLESSLLMAHPLDPLEMCQQFCAINGKQDGEIQALGTKIGHSWPNSNRWLWLRNISFQTALTRFSNSFRTAFNKRGGRPQAEWRAVAFGVLSGTWGLGQVRAALSDCNSYKVQR